MDMVLWSVYLLAVAWTVLALVSVLKWCHSAPATNP